MRTPISTWGVRETDRWWYVRSVSERTTSGTVRTWDWNLPCVEFPMPTWTWEYPRRLISHNVFIRVSLVATGWWQRRRQARKAVESPSSTGRQSTYLHKRSRSVGRTLSPSRWRRVTGGGLSLGTAWPQTTPQPYRTSLRPSASGPGGGVLLVVGDLNTDLAAP